MIRKKRQMLTRSITKSYLSDHESSKKSKRSSPKVKKVDRVVIARVLDSSEKSSEQDSQSGSQTDICDVGWQSSSPISLTQAARIGQDDEYDEEREAAIRKLVENSVPTSVPSCTPPLHELLTDHRIEPERTKANLLSSGSREERQSRGRPKGIKSAINTKEFISKINVLINIEEEERLKQKRNENHTRVVKPNDEEVTQIPKPTKSPQVFPDSEPLFTQDKNRSLELFTSTQINKDVSRNHALRACTVASASNAGISSTIRKLDGSPLVSSQGLARRLMEAKMSPKYASSPVQSPLGPRKGESSCEELWTDEDDSFMLKATQEDMFVTPKAHKRPNPDSRPLSSTKVSKLKLCLNSLSPIPALKETDRIGNLGVVNSQQVPFQSYYEKNKFSSGAFNTCSVNKENYSSSNHVEAATSTIRVNRSTVVSNKPSVAPSKSEREQVYQVPCVLNTTESHAVRAQHTISKKSHMGPPNNTGKPANEQNSFTVVNSTKVSNNARVRQAPPLSGSRKHYGGGQGSSGNQVLAMASAPRHKTETANARQTSFIKPSSTSISSKRTHVDANTQLKPSVTNQAKTKVPRVSALAQSNDASPAKLNVSLTDDLLASLAEPDDMLDSQVDRDDSTKEIGKLNADKTLPNGTSKIRDEPPPIQNSETKAVDCDDFFASDEDDPELLKVLDEAETQHSQGKKTECAIAQPHAMTTNTTPCPINRLENEAPTLVPSDNNRSIDRTIGSRGMTRSQTLKRNAPKVNSGQGNTWTFKKTVKSQTTKTVQAGIEQQSNAMTTPLPIQSRVDGIPGSSSGSSLSEDQRCSPEEIERKKREAMERRKNRLKLKRK